MKRDYLGDSYDAVKRMWKDMFVNWAPLYAEPRFIPDDLQAEFTLLTGIPILSDKAGPFSILNDPDTGIRLPGEENQSEGRTHIAIDSIAGQLRSGALCVITFDQSNYRNRNMKSDQQRRVKMQALADKGFQSFYYVSHAPFLFATPDPHSLLQVKTILWNAGIPEWRLAHIEKGPNEALHWIAEKAGSQ